MKIYEIDGLGFTSVCREVFYESFIVRVFIGCSFPSDDWASGDRSVKYKQTNDTVS